MLAAEVGSIAVEDTILRALQNPNLPPSVRNLILHGQGSQFLNAVAEASFDYDLTDLLVPLYPEIATDTAQRWIHRASSGERSGQIRLLTCLSRILPLLPYLGHTALDVLVTSRVTQDVSLLTPLEGEIDHEVLASLLVASFRLLSHDLDAFSDHIRPVFLCSLFNHARSHIRYLAIECFCMVMHFADAFVQDLIEKHIGSGPIYALWEGKEIDYRLLKLYEERRWEDLNDTMMQFQNQVDAKRYLTRFDHQSDLHVNAVSIAGVITPKLAATHALSSSFVHFDTSVMNLRKTASKLNGRKPILLTGQSGAGKTAIIREVAHSVGILPKLVTLHLNEQTDAKSLLGIYTSSTTGSGFSWQPGVLTKAVQEGRWILIEDIDRAPADVLGLLRPLIENNRLFLPSRKERLRPKEGFRLFGTIRTSTTGGSYSHGKAFLSNERLWDVVAMSEYTHEEIGYLLRKRFPNLAVFISGILSAHTRLLTMFSTEPSLRGLHSRLPNIRDLLKWCRRLSRRLTLISNNKPQIPDTFIIDMLKDGLDCYTAYFSDSKIVHMLALAMAECINISPAAAEHVVLRHNPVIQEHGSSIQVGRSSLPVLYSSRSKTLSKSGIALTRKVRQNMEAIAAAADAQEPLLLVGETGVGKTSILQHIATSIGQSLTVINLSNQSEASDLLGGLKPITTHSLIVPLYDEFNDLFEKTFSSGKNAKFRDSIVKAFMKQKWTRVIGHWEEAVGLALKSLQLPQKPTLTSEQIAKRRKLDDSKYYVLRERWSQFVQSLNIVKAQIQKSNQNQVFAFVESRLVQALRTGGWLLLDEINLASSETLDSIQSLLHNGEDDIAHLFLTESGNVERINSHPNFRVMAAMNPATDTGKKDLPPAIRSYFTEIFVQAGDDDLNDLIEIIQVYLGPALENDKKAASDLAKVYIAMKQLNAQHKLTDGAGDLPHYSLRTLTRCLHYVRHHYPTYGLRWAMYEGVQMSFFTVLDQKSQHLVLSVIERHLVTSQQGRSMKQPQNAKHLLDTKTFVLFENYAISRGTIPTESQPDYIITESVKQNLINLARSASMRRFPVLLQGPTSAGKTSMIEYLAKFTGNKFVRINNHEHTDLQEYLGSYVSGADGKLEYRAGVLVDALRMGHWIVLDELNLAPSDVLEALNRLLDDNRELLIPETQELIRPHPNFMLFATQNPAGLYGGRKRLSRAFRNRFLEIHVDDIPQSELEIILTKRAQIAPSFCREIVEVYKILSLQRQSSRLFETRNSFATLRDLFRWASRPVDTREQLARHGYMLLAERVRDPAEKAVVKNTIESIMKLKIDEVALYHENQIPQSLKSGSKIIWTKAMRRLYVLVSQALKNNEPVLLVGETGCGKTQICQCIAEAFDKKLNIYNAHSNTETGDLIGSQRPIRHKSDLAKNIMEGLLNLGDQYSDVRPGNNIGVEELIAQFKQMDTTSFDKHAVMKVNESIAAYQSLFVWNDGSLVRSMKEGSHFLLDEISLADDSVLERMNSLLEPGRSMLLAEKGTEDNFVVAEPGFQFLSTMNPGGDYGKRELSAALRNRLTEIWVPSLSDSEEVIPILQAKLHHIDTVVSSRMVDFARFFSIEVQGSNLSWMPLRTLISWANFVTTNSTITYQHAIVHGAAISFIDSLGANPAGVANGPVLDMAPLRETCLEKLSILFEIDAKEIYNALPIFRLNSEYLQIGPFTVSRQTNAVSASDLVFEAPTTLKNAMRILRGLQTDRPILLEGNPGVGKTAIVSAIAKICGRALTRINLSDQTDIMDLFGADVPTEGQSTGNFTWRDGPLLKAIQTGGWVLLDEMNLASQSVLEGLNACLDHRKEVHISELDRTFQCHPDFTLFATQNPHHQGGGRKGLPASFVNRFTVVYADPFTEDDLVRICRLKRPTSSHDQIEKAVSVIGKCQSLAAHMHEFSDGGPWELNLRDLSRWMDLCEAVRTIDPVKHFSTVVAHRFRNEQARRQALNVCNTVLGPGEEETTYHNLTKESIQIGTTICARSKSRQNTWVQEFLHTLLLPAAKSFLVAWQQRWPVILVGSSGAGKSSLIRTLSAFTGNKLVEFSMTADVDTADLIGGFEQNDSIRAASALQFEAREILAETVRHLSDVSSSNEFHNFVKVYEQLCEISSEPADILDKVTPLVPGMNPPDRAAMEVVITRLRYICDAKSTNQDQFVWNDGVLIDAIKSGSWLVLDNANLCNPSVLDRLNSLLEPDGHLILSEQHHKDGEIRTLSPHPNFRIVMTMDPKHGELSRAMRNRSLEIFINTSFDATGQLKLPKYPTASNLMRLRPLFHRKPRGKIDLKCKMQLEPWIDQLTGDDLRVFQKLQADPKLLIAQQEAEVRDNFHPLYEKIEHRTRLLMDPKRFSILKLADLPQLAAVNEPILQHLIPRGAMSHIGRLTRIQLLSNTLLRRLRYLQDVEAGKHNSKTKSWLAISSPRFNRVKRTQSPAVDAFSILQNLGSFAASTIETAISNVDTSTGYRTARDATMLLVDLLVLFDQTQVEDSQIQAYLQVAEDLSRCISNDEYQASRHVFEEGVLKGLRKRFGLVTGYDLQRMWPSWKGKSASTRSQLESRLVIEGLIVKLDEVFLSLPQSRNQLAELRLRMIDAYKRIPIIDEDTSSVEALSHCITELLMESPNENLTRPLFASIFDKIQYKSSLQDCQLSASQYQEIYLLSGRPTIPLLESQYDEGPVAVLRKLGDYRFSIGDTFQETITPPGEFALLDLAQRLQNLSEQPIGRMKYIQEEFMEMVRYFCKLSKQLSTSNLYSIRKQAFELVRQILLPHSELLEFDLHATLSNNQFSDYGVAKLLERSKLSTSSQRPDSINEMLAQLYEACTRFEKISGTNVQSYKECSEALVILSLCCLRCFVPDKIFDPSVYPALVQERHERRRAELESRINTWRDFQHQTTGQGTSLILSILDEELLSLGDLRETPVVYRAESTILDALGGEFQNLLRVVINTNLAKQALSDDSVEALRAAEQLLSRVKTSVERLLKIHRAYDDLTTPVVGLLHLLSLGLRMGIYSRKRKAQHEMHQSSVRERGQGNHLALYAESHCFNSLSDVLMSKNVLSEEQTNQVSGPQLWVYLKQLRLRLFVTESQTLGDHQLFSLIITVIDKFYQQWKRCLSDDQKEADKKARYYSYRGEDDFEEASGEEVRQMFPRHDVEEQSSTTVNVSDTNTLASDQGVNQTLTNEDQGLNINVHKTNIELAKFHRSLFGSFDPHELAKEVLRGHFTADTETNTTFGPEEYLTAEVMPGLLLCLDEKAQTLSSNRTSAGLNIYVDHDIAETKKLFEITTRALSRFREIGEHWTEHAVPAEVRAFCNEVMSLKLSDPIAKIMTKAEKLLDIITQWQVVASKEWSVSNILDSLTGLIIHWRRLELGSWSRLLDLEDQKQQDDADAWYFIAYEAVIYNSLTIVRHTPPAEAEEVLTTYSRNLAKTLEEYLRSTTLGQFSSRLELLDVFARTVKAYAEDLNAGTIHSTSVAGDVLRLRQQYHYLITFHNVVVNVVEHHTRYLSRVRQMLKEGRFRLENDITEQIKLASWKDTNITALRESARRSHFKLFKIVKKYRALLAQPITNFQSDYVESSKASKEVSDLRTPDIARHSIQKHVQRCSDEIVSWHQRPERLRDPIAAANTMRYTYQSKLPDFRPSSDLQFWYEDVSTSVQQLRKATPAILTDDNKALVRDLKQRKRRLLAESLKDMALMGIRRNLATSELDNQSSMATVLSSVPTLTEDHESALSLIANAAFHEFIDILPSARQASIQHSDDLTDGETRKGLGYLEGCLCLAMKQRVQVGNFKASLSRLTKIAFRLHDLLRIPATVNQFQEPPVHATKHFSSNPASLPLSLDITADIIDIQSKYGSLNTEGISTSMREHGSKLRQLHTKYSDATSISIACAVNPDVLALANQIDEEFARIKDNVEDWISQEPQIEPAMTPLAKLLNDDTFTVPTSDVPSSLNALEIDRQIQDTLNVLFVALQQSTTALTALPQSSEDRNWLADASQTYGRSLSSLQLDSICDTLHVVLARISTSDGGEVDVIQSILITAIPIILQFQFISEHLFNRLLSLHEQTCRMAVFLGRTFTSLVTEGFCSPSEASDGEEQSSKVEQGTGLGEGEAAQDISKDVGDDEDLSDLAQERSEQEQNTNGIEKSKDAVDMGINELEGDVRSGDEDQLDEEQDGSDENGEDQNMDEETGSVDDLDPNAVDEKMWDDMKKEAENEEKNMKSQKAQGQKSNEEAAGTGDKDQQDMDDEMENDEVGDEDQEDTNGEQRPEGENTDPHLDQQPALELPEDVQLNGEEEKDDSVSDVDMEDLSDMGDPQAETAKETDLSDDDKTDRGQEADRQETVNDEDEQSEGQAQGDEVAEDQKASDDEDNDTKHETRQDHATSDAQDQDDGEAGLADTGQSDVDAKTGLNGSEAWDEVEETNQAAQQQEASDTNTQEQDTAGQGKTEHGRGNRDETVDRQTRALQKLADVLEQYHERREIFTASQDRQKQTPDQDVEMADADFEHLADEKEVGEAQALGTAAEENTQDLNRGQAIEDSRAAIQDDLPIPESVETEISEVEPESLAQKMDRLQRQREEWNEQKPTNHVRPEPLRQQRGVQPDQNDIVMKQDDTDFDEVVNAHQEAKEILPTLTSQLSLPNLTDAQQLWSMASNRTQSLSLVLTEQLRLILQPTTATKLRGDFRTGKRLNIRRIIPYIASGYKRDKIWMRRSIPSKRNYQVMLAVDDSKSMAESGADILALETLCMLSRGLSMLEVGELSIVAFGKDYNDSESGATPRTVKIAHPFSMPFSPSSSGPNTFSCFSFDQTGTNIRGLMNESIALFKDARAKSSVREAADLWQLQLIISDGHIGSSSDDSVRRLVRQAREEKIMSVFVIVDNGEESIVDLPEVVFEKVKEGEEPVMVKKRYLDGFPFQYYIVVRQVRELPGVLSRVLKGWFEGIVEQG